MNALFVALGSGGLLLLFLLLLYIEERNGKRLILRSSRSFLDGVSIRTYRYLLHAQRHIGSGALRITFHYVLHGVLGWMLEMSQKIGVYVEQLQRRNYRTVRSVKNEQEKTHLDLIAEHKVDTTLSEQQRTQLKERSLERPSY